MIRFFIFLKYSRLCKKGKKPLFHNGTIKVELGKNPVLQGSTGIKEAVNNVHVLYIWYVTNDEIFHQAVQ